VSGPGNTVKLDAAGLYRALRKFEKAYAEMAGETLESGEFYERYCAGVIDTQFSAMWAAFYEALDRQARTGDDEAGRMLDELLPSVALT
jgi:hypothetical protein